MTYRYLCPPSRTAGEDEIVSGFGKSILFLELVVRKIAEGIWNLRHCNTKSIKNMKQTILNCIL